jgi:hypothetical protein
MFGHANVRYYLDGPRKPPLHPKRTDNFTRIDSLVYELPHVAPVVMYVPLPRVVANVEEGLRQLATIEPGSGAVVEATRPVTGPPGASVVAGRVVDRSSNRLVAEITTPGPGLVVINEAYYPVWKATVDDEEVDIVPANVMFRGVFVTSAGTHRIEMTMTPMRFWALLPLWFIALGLFCWAAFAEIRERRRSA